MCNAHRKPCCSSGGHITIRQVHVLHSNTLLRSDVAQKYLFYALSIVGQDIGGYVGNLVGEDLVNISR